MPTHRRIVLASRPQAEVSPDNFRLETVETPSPAEGQVLVRNHWLSLDPYMRGRMNEGRSYAECHSATARGAWHCGGHLASDCTDA